MDFLAMFTPKAIAAYWAENVSNRIPYMGEGLFPGQKKAGLDLSWIKGSKGLPVSLMPSAFDAKATYRDRIGVKSVNTEMPFFREGFKIKEKDRQDLLRAVDRGDGVARAIIAQIYNDAAELIEGANVAAERMRMALLFPDSGNMQIVIQANGVDYSYNYDPAGAWKLKHYTALTSTDVWSDYDDSDPLDDISTVRDTIAQATGEKIRYAIMNTTTFNHLVKNESIKNRYITKNGLALGYLTKGEVRAVIEDTTEVIPVVYDKQYENESGVAAKFVPDGYVSFVPEGNLGNTWYGTTPEEADLRASNQAEVEIVNTGVAVTTEIIPHPVNKNIIASEIVLPSFERMDSTYLLKVL